MCRGRRGGLHKGESLSWTRSLEERGFVVCLSIFSISTIWSQLSKSVLTVKAKNISVMCCLARNLMIRCSELMPNHKESPVLWHGWVMDVNWLPALQMTVFAVTSLGFLHPFIPVPLCFSLQRFLGYFPLNNRVISSSCLATLLLLNWRPGLLKIGILLCSVSQDVLACDFCHVLKPSLCWLSFKSSPLEEWRVISGDASLAI